jgi:hypothetical protein
MKTCFYRRRVKAKSRRCFHTFQSNHTARHYWIWSVVLRVECEFISSSANRRPGEITSRRNKLNTFYYKVPHMESFVHAWIKHVENRKNWMS